MRVPRSQRPLEDIEGPAVQRLRLVQPAQSGQQDGEVVDGQTGIRMIGS